MLQPAKKTAVNVGAATTPPGLSSEGHVFRLIKKGGTLQSASSRSHLIDLLLVQVKDLAGGGGGDLLVRPVARLRAVPAVAGQHKHHLGKTQKGGKGSQGADCWRALKRRGFIWPPGDSGASLSCCTRRRTAALSSRSCSHCQSASETRTSDAISKLTDQRHGNKKALVLF